MEYNKIHDITLNIENSMLSFPGDTVPKIEKIKEASKDNYNLSKMRVSVHVGTHVDAPSHFIVDGKNIEEIPPERFLGQVQVVEIKDKNEITKRELENINIKSDKILFKTKNSDYLKEENFNDNFVYLTYEGAKYLLNKEIKLIGIDYLTIEELGAGSFSVHKLLLGNEVLVIEAIDLTGIEEGMYYLHALPLKLKGCEASPIRALLFE